MDMNKGGGIAGRSGYAGWKGTKREIIETTVKHKIKTKEETSTGPDLIQGEGYLQGWEHQEAGKSLRANLESIYHIICSNKTLNNPAQRGFDSKSGHTSRLWAGPWLGHLREATIAVSLAHQCFSPSLSPSLPLSLTKNKQTEKH